MEDSSHAARPIKMDNKLRFAAGWAANQLMEELFNRLKGCYIKSIIMQPPFTMEQMLDKAKSVV